MKLSAILIGFTALFCAEGVSIPRTTDTSARALSVRADSLPNPSNFKVPTGWKYGDIQCSNTWVMGARVEDIKTCISALKQRGDDYMRAGKSEVGVYACESLIGGVDALSVTATRVLVVKHGDAQRNKYSARVKYSDVACAAEKLLNGCAHGSWKGVGIASGSIGVCGTYRYRPLVSFGGHNWGPTLAELEKFTGK